MKIIYFFKYKGPCNISTDKDTDNTDAYFAIYWFYFTYEQQQKRFFFCTFSM